MDVDYVVIPGLILLAGIVVVWLSLRTLLSMPVETGRRSWRVVKRVVLSIVMVIAVALAGCTTYNAAALLWFRMHNPPPGEMYQVNGRTMHMYCTGSGSPTVVLDAGLGNDALIWSGFQPELARTTRVCAYDRAGFGWSEARPAPRDADHIAEELHGLLQAAHVEGPIVLMGHSISGIYMRDYAMRYQDELAGLVFVDGSTPMQQENPAFKAASSGGPPPWLGALLERTVSIVGIPRLQGQCSQSFPGFDAHAAKLQAEDLCHPQLTAVTQEIDSMGRSGQETIHAGPFGALPILIFSQDPAKGGMPPPIKNAWNQMQEDSKKLSSRSRRIIAKGSSHYIQLDRLDLLKTEVPRFIEQIRGTLPETASYGSTITE